MRPGTQESAGDCRVPHRIRRHNAAPQRCAFAPPSSMHSTARAHTPQGRGRGRATSRALSTKPLSLLNALPPAAHRCCRPAVPSGLRRGAPPPLGRSSEPLAPRKRPDDLDAPARAAARADPRHAPGSAAPGSAAPGVLPLRPALPSLLPGRSALLPAAFVGPNRPARPR